MSVIFIAVMVIGIFTVLYGFLLDCVFTETPDEYFAKHPEEPVYVDRNARSYANLKQIQRRIAASRPIATEKPKEASRG